MIGEFGGIGAFQSGHMWTPHGCFAYKANPTAHDQATTYAPFTLPPFHPFLCNGEKIEFVYLIATMPGTCIGGNTTSQSQETCRAIV